MIQTVKHLNKNCLYTKIENELESKCMYLDEIKSALFIYAGGFLTRALNDVLMFILDIKLLLAAKGHPNFARIPMTLVVKFFLHRHR